MLSYAALLENHLLHKDFSNKTMTDQLRQKIRIELTWKLIKSFPIQELDFNLKNKLSHETFDK